MLRAASRGRRCVRDEMFERDAIARWGVEIVQKEALPAQVTHAGGTVLHRMMTLGRTASRSRGVGNAAAISCFAVAALALTLLVSVDSCKVVIVSPSTGSSRDDGLPFDIAYRIQSSPDPCSQPIVSAELRIDGNFVLASKSKCDSFLPLVATAPALACCSHILELCVSNLPGSCSRANVTITPPPTRPWSPTITGQGASGRVAHNQLLAAALGRLFPAHEPLLDMSCDKYLLSHRGARKSSPGDALTLSYDYSRQPLSQFSHCIAECASPPPSHPPHAILFLLTPPLPPLPL